MIPRILNLQARPPAAGGEPCEPDVHYFPLDSGHSSLATGHSVIAFDANTLVAVEISKAQHEALTAPLARQACRGLTAREPPAANPQSAVRNPQSEAARRLLFSGVRPKFDLSPDVTCRQLTLHLSDQCNQHCKYCWIAKGSGTAVASGQAPADLPRQGDQRPATDHWQLIPAVMTRRIAAAALTMFPPDGRDLRIGFFGGEPLLHFGLLMVITEMAEQRAARSPVTATGRAVAGKAKALCHVTTNATLVTPLVARFLAEHGFSIIVSCDGPENLHDAARGAGSHAAMLRGLAMLHRAGCSGRVALRGTWSGAEPEIMARLKALNELCAQGLAAGVALEPVAGAPYGGSLDAEIRNACFWFGTHARSGGTLHWQYLEKTLQRILWQQFRASECGAGRGYYTVGPTGLIYACHKQQNSEIGRMVDGCPANAVVVDQMKREKWLDNRLCARRECSLCWARHVCGGACRSESLEFCGGIGEPHAGRCMLMRQIVAEALRLAATLPRETLLRICPAPSSRNSG